MKLREALAEPNLLLSMPGLGLRATFELRSQQAILALVASGGGIALSPRMSVEGRKDVVALELEPPLQREVGWVRRKGRHLPRIADELLGLLI